MDDKLNSVSGEHQANRDHYEAMLTSIAKSRSTENNVILVVDDEVAIRRFVSRGIKKNDPTVVVFEAENGADALEKLKLIREKYNKDPLFIVTDLNMPVMDGWDLIDRLYKQYSNDGKTQGIPVIVLSSTSGEKGLVFRKTVHHGQSKYKPMVSVAKEACTAPANYDARGEQGLASWITHFLRAS